MNWNCRSKSLTTREYWIAGLSVTMGASLGAGVMYFCDPNRGRARRKEFTEQTVSFLSKGERLVEHKGKDILNPAGDVLAEAESRFEHGKKEEVSDEVLLGRVRSRMGHLVTHPQSISAAVRKGGVTLTGTVGRAEKKHLLKGIGEIPGISKVEDFLAYEGRQNGRSVPRLLGSMAGAVMLIALAGGRSHFASRRAA